MDIKNINWLRLAKDNVAVLVVILLFIISIAMSDAFLTTQNIFNLLRQLAPPTLIALGMFFVIMTGGVDLSVGSVVAMSAVFTAHFMNADTGLGMGLVPSISLVLLIAAVFGFVTGYFVAVRRLAPFVVTLAGMTIARGIAFIVSRGMPIRITHTGFNSFATANIFGVPTMVWFVGVVVLVLALVQRYTVFGRFVQAAGSNETATKLSGINTNFYKIGVFMMSAMLSAMAGIMVASRIRAGTPLAGMYWELDAIAAVVIGGASLAGGTGKVLHTLMGVWVLGLIGNIMDLRNIAAYPQQVLQGVIIILAILLQTDRKGKDISSSSKA